MRELQAGFGQFVRKPLFSALAVLLLAVGIGANVLIFSFIDALLLKPVPVRDPANLWLLEGEREQQVRPNLDFSYGQYLELSKHTDLFSGVTAEEEWSVASAYPSADSNGVRLVMTQMLAPNYFQELGVTAQLGRLLTASDAALTTNVPALLSYQFWQARYGGRPDIVGRTIRLKNYPFTIVGVLPRDFHSIDIERAPDVRLPISAAPFLLGRQVSDPRDEDRQIEDFRLLVRLRAGVKAGVMQQVLARPLHQALESELLLQRASFKHPIPANDQTDLHWIYEERLALVPAGHGISRLRTQFSRALQMLMAGVIVLLVAVCANVAGLLMARGEERRKELAVRLSLGASRGRLLRQLMWENLFLAIPGGAFGVLLAYAMTPSLLRVLPPVRSLYQDASPQILTLTADLRGLLFAGAALLVSLCLFGLIPAWRATRLDLNAELKGTAALAPHSLAALIPIALQVMLSVLLLAASGLLLRSYWNLEHLNPGFDRTPVLSFTLGMVNAGFTPAQSAAYQTELERRIEQLPGVRSVAFSNLGLMRGSGLKTTLTRPGVNQAKSVFLNTSFAAVTPKYFETLGIPLLAGRNLTLQDNGAKPAHVVINRALADLLYPHENPVGQWLVNGRDGSKPPASLIVGLVETAKFRQMQESAPPTFYHVLTGDDRLVLFVRTAGDPAGIVKPAEEVIRKLGSGVPVIEESLLEQEVQNTMWQERLVARLASFFSLIALLLASMGLYGTLAFSVARRKRELGIRVAIGAHVRHIVATVCGRMSWAVGVGLIAGLLVAAGALQLTQKFLFDVDALDKTSFAGASFAVLLCTGVAALIPCRRAIHSDAAAALRGG